MKTAIQKAEEKGFKKGVTLAADIARSYNSSSSHPYDLGDCILGKLNQIGKKKIRKNPFAQKSGITAKHKRTPKKKPLTNQELTRLRQY